LRGGEVAVTPDGVGAAVRVEARVGGEALCDRAGVAERFVVADAVTRALLDALVAVDAADVSGCVLVGGGAACLVVPPLASTTATVPATSTQKADAHAINALRDSRIEGHLGRRRLTGSLLGGGNGSPFAGRGQPTSRRSTATAGQANPGCGHLFRSLGCRTALRWAGAACIV
jgi:hypothetical protein